MTSPVVRQNGRIVSVAVIVAVRVNTDVLLGMDVGPSDATTVWTAVRRTLAWPAGREASFSLVDFDTALSGNKAEPGCFAVMVYRQRYSAREPWITSQKERCHMPTTNSVVIHITDDIGLAGGPKITETRHRKPQVALARLIKIHSQMRGWEWGWETRVIQVMVNGAPLDAEKAIHLSAYVSALATSRDDWIAENEALKILMP